MFIFNTVLPILLFTVIFTLYRDRARVKAKLAESDQLLREAIPLLEAKAEAEELERKRQIAEQHFFDQTPGWDGFVEEAYNARFQRPRSYGPTSWASATHCEDGTPYGEVDPATLAEDRTIPLSFKYAVNRHKAGKPNPYAINKTADQVIEKQDVVSEFKLNPNEVAQNSKNQA